VVVDSVFVSVVVVVAGAVGAVFRLVRWDFVWSGVSLAGGAAGAVTSVFCSHAPKSAAVAMMQSNFFMVIDGFCVEAKRESAERTWNQAYGFGLVDVVVVVSVFVSAGFSLITVVSFFSVGFTIVVLFSVFFSAGAAGATVSVFCSHAPKSAALARMQISFFIVMVDCPSWD
jgi:hypothetical protein